MNENLTILIVYALFMAVSYTLGLHFGTTDKIKKYNERISQLELTLEDTLDWLENNPDFDYRNGNEHNGIDEGHVLGWKHHDELCERIKEVLEE